MKKHILLWALLGCLIVSRVDGQQVKIVYPGYTAYWNAKTLIPDSVLWVVTPHKKAVGREAGFHATDTRKNLSKDYLHSGYDIGHNCDASDENGSKIDEYNSFDFANTYPQKPNCNRLTWLALENYTRALNKPVHVKVWWVGINTYIGVDKVAVPSYCVKQLKYDGKIETYVMPNCDTVSKHVFTYYRVKN